MMGYVLMYVIFTLVMGSVSWFYWTAKSWENRLMGHGLYIVGHLSVFQFSVSFLSQRFEMDDATLGFLFALPSTLLLMLILLVIGVREIIHGIETKNNTLVVGGVVSAGALVLLPITMAFHIGALLILLIRKMVARKKQKGGENNEKNTNTN